LVLSTISLWLPRFRNKWLILCGIANILAYVLGIIHLTGILMNILLVYTIYSYNDRDSGNRVFSGTVICVLALLYLTHIVPGISNLLLIQDVTHPDSVTYDFYLNFDKTLFGLLLVAFMRIIPVKSFREYFEVVKSIKLELGILTIILLIFAMITGYIKFSPKLPTESIIWLFHNLFSTAIAEEGFFRLFLQASIISWLMMNYNKLGKIWNLIAKICALFRIDLDKHKQFNSKLEAAMLGIFITSLIFGIAHYQGGIRFIILSLIAGLAYGWGYYKTSKIEAAITIHFLVNAIHYFFFTYPIGLEG